ncbi:MAG: iron-sulfur cluster insertion protein ErpA [Gammaproteobacteria bacterium]|nr:iron-sulfur cluster insertion protein ErpA [Gammaproteobacteria bacterium]
MQEHAELLFSDQAAAKVRRMLVSEEADGTMLRVYIEGGGCSGFQYGFELDSSVEEDDIVIENGDVKLLIDPLSIQYLSGGIVDYKEDLQGSRFVIDNPNAKSTCGCGASFSL